jgi:hypothetical protein
MSDRNGNNTATLGGRGMNLIPCKVRGHECWKLETYSAGKRKRQFFRDYGKAQKALAEARKYQAQVGRAFDVLSAREKAQIMVVLQDIQQAGHTLPGIWEAFKSIPNTPKASRTLKQAVEEVLAAKLEANCRPRHIKNLKWYLGKFIEGRQQQSVRAITGTVIEDWFKGRAEKPRAKKGHIGLLSSLFAHCLRKGYIAENPIKRLDPVHIDRNTPAILTLRQSEEALLWAKRQKPELLAWLILTLFCGLRPDAEADFIDWSMIDLKHGRIVISKSKIRHVPHRILDLSFCPPALEWLKLAKARKCPLPLKFVTRRRYLRKLRAYLRFERWPQDILRHTAASNLLAFHQDAGKVASFLGNSPGVLLAHYKALIFKEDAAKFMALLPCKPTKQKRISKRLVMPRCEELNECALN